MLFKYSLFLIFVLKCVNSAKILAIFWTPIQSHHLAGVPLLQALAKKGHNVHLMSTFQDKVNISTYKQTRLTGMFEFSTDDFEADASGAYVNHPTNDPEEVKKKAENFWKNKVVRNVVRKKRKYDVIICLAHHTDHIFPIAHHINAPLILFSPYSTNIHVHKYVGQANLPYYIHPYMEGGPERFKLRIAFLASNVITSIIDKLYVTDLYEKITRNYLPKAPPLSELNVSLILVNSHYSIETPRPYLPSMIPIGGYHLKEFEGELPGKIGEFLRTATGGAVVWSMGTNLNVEEVLDVSMFMETFNRLPQYKFLVKSDVPIPNAPENVMVVNWIESQADVLAHPNVKGFITHGGLDGLIEATYHAVPMIGFPQTAEEKVNINKGFTDGHAVRLDRSTLTIEKLAKFIREIMENPTYRENALKRSLIMKKRPVDPMKYAIYWVEHIIQHKGGDHLRSVAANFAWYQLYMVDVLAFQIVVVMGTTIIFYLMTSLDKYVRRRRGEVQAEVGAPPTPRPPPPPRAPASPSPSASPEQPATPENQRGSASPSGSASANPHPSPSGSASANPHPSPSGSASANPHLSPSCSASPNAQASPSCSASPGTSASPTGGAAASPGSSDSEGEEDGEVPGPSHGGGAQRPRNVPKKRGRKNKRR